MEARRNPDKSDYRPETGDRRPKAQTRNLARYLGFSSDSVSSVFGLIAAFFLIAAAQAGAPPANPAAKSLAKVLRVAKTSAVRPSQELREAIFQAQIGKKDLGRLRAAASATRAGMASLRDGLRDTAFLLNTAGDDTLEPFLGTIIGYYGLKGILHLAWESFHGDCGLSEGDLADLDLILPAKVADTLAKVQSKLAAQGGLDAFDLSFQLTDVPVGAGPGIVPMKKVSLTAREASRFRMGAFMAFPDMATADKALRFQALKLTFLKQALLGGYLYPEERVDAPLPASADTALKGLQVQAGAMENERAFRRMLSGATLERLAKGVAVSRKDFTGAALRFFKEAAAVFAKRVDQDKLDRFGGTPEKLAWNFLTVESQQRAASLGDALKASPIYLTEMGEEELGHVVADASQAVVANIATVALAKGMLDMRGLTPAEQAMLLLLMNPMLEAAADAAAIPASAFWDIDRMRAEHEDIIPFRRYELATKVISAVDFIDATKDLLQAAGGGETVALNFVEKNPEPGMVLLAMKSRQEIPAWVLEMLEYLASRAARADAGKGGPKGLASRDQLETIARTTPDRVLRLAQDARDKGRDESLTQEIQWLHKDKLQFRNYQWMSIDARLMQLGKHMQSEGARGIIADFLAMNKYADTVSSPDLRGKVRNALDVLVRRTMSETDELKEQANGAFGGFSSFLDWFPGKVEDAHKAVVTSDASPFQESRLSGLDELIAELTRARDYVADRREFIHALFGPGTERGEYLRGLLTSGEVFRNYLAIRIKEVENELPILFMPVPLHSRAAAEAGNPDGVMLYDLVSRVRRIAIPRLGADASLTGPISGIRITPNDLVATAMKGSRVDDSLWFRALDSILDRVGPWFGETHVDAPHDDSFWPRAFTARDVLPARFDPEKDARVRTERVVVGTLLAPYLRSNATAARDEQAVLLDPAADNRKKLLASAAFRQVSIEAGDEVAEGMSAMQRRSAWLKERIEQLKRITSKTQYASNIMFYMTLFLDMPVGAHMITGNFMAWSCAFDLFSDLELFVDYWNSYADLSVFAWSGGLGNGLSEATEVEAVRNELHQTADVLASRLPMDMMFLGSLGHGYLMNAKMLHMQHKMRRLVQRHSLNELELHMNIAKLAQAYYELGVDFRMTPEQVVRYAKKRVKTLLPKLAGSPEARDEMAAWEAALRQEEILAGKYPEDVYVLIRGGKFPAK